MVRTICLCVGFFFCLLERIPAQVGINTIDPKAQLDIASSNSVNPETTDGLLIPRLENFPVEVPTIEQDGMLVYLKTAKTNFPKGFYFWNAGTASWTSIANTTLYNFYKEGTVLPAEGVVEGIYRTGNMGIGEESPDAKLKVFLGPETDHSSRTALEVDNSSSSADNVTYGILSNNWSITNSRKYGIKTNVSAAGKGVHYGIYNEVYQNSVEEIYGLFNKVGRTYGASKNHYGIFSEIGTPLGSGYVYGLYSAAFGSTADKVYAGYFAGRLGIGSTYEDHYVLPTERGSSHQVLVSDGESQVNWAHPNRMVYTSTGALTGNFSIPDDTYSLRINNQVSSITIPEASLNAGRILVLLGWNGISPKSFNFTNGDEIWDIVSGSSLTSIASGERFMIQSDGDRWLLLFR